MKKIMIVCPVTVFDNRYPPFIIDTRKVYYDLKETFFNKVAVAFFVPVFPNIFIFFETRTLYKVAGKKTKKIGHV